ncbi:MAG: helix-turn-helix transcriptional regulator [Kiritimatiellae bacterium]|nr:helix-turn-helix transcriptional regulator [Kiritimatiellia bacterium]
MSFSLSARDPIGLSLVCHRGREEGFSDMHYPLEVGVVLRGRMRRYYGGWEMDVAPGQVWLCGVWEPHGFRILLAPCEVVVLVVVPEFLLNLRRAEDLQLNWLSPFSRHPPDRPQAHGDSRAQVLAIARRLKRAGRVSARHHRIWRRVLLMELLLTLMHDGSLPASGERGLAQARVVVNPAVDLVFATRRFVSEQTAARACGMCRNAFNRHFREATGTSFAKFALRHRLSGAGLQLTQTDDPIKAVAANWGFTDASHLHRCFTRHFACTPAEYRERGGARVRPLH